MYAKEWVSVVIPLRPDLSEPEARLLTQGVFSMLNTAAMLKKGLDETSIRSIMRQAALHALLGRGDLRSAQLAHCRLVKMAVDELRYS